ncbi:MAG: type II toxin-antitoxin system RelE/ParE family toxin [Candidatus Saccharimonadales bacterium]
MMVAYSKHFIKQAKKLDPNIKQKLQIAIREFTEDPLQPSLHNHQLKGKFKDYRSINITGDIRALYLPQADKAVFDAVGTHSQLYG